MDMVWPLHQVVSYTTETVDTHNSMDTGTGAFTAPFSGTFEFIFYATFVCTYDPQSLYLLKNSDTWIEIHYCELLLTDSGSDYVFESNSVHFSLDLQQGESVRIESGTAQIHLKHFPAKFTGFLLKKN